MKQARDIDSEGARSTLNRRNVLSGAVASGIVGVTHTASAFESTPQATPETGGAIDESRVMKVSDDLSGGANLKAGHVGGLLSRLNSDEANLAAFEELEAVDEFTDDAMAAVSPDAQQLAANILQYWFLGRYDNVPVEDRADMFFDLACWQTLPYATQPSTCKSFGYWAVEIEL